MEEDSIQVMVPWVLRYVTGDASEWVFAIYGDINFTNYIPLRREYFEVLKFEV